MSWNRMNLVNELKLCLSNAGHNVTLEFGMEGYHTLTANEEINIRFQFGAWRTANNVDIKIDGKFDPEKCYVGNFTVSEENTSEKVELLFAEVCSRIELVKKKTDNRWLEEIKEVLSVGWNGSYDGQLKFDLLPNLPELSMNGYGLFMSTLTQLWGKGNDIGIELFSDNSILLNISNLLYLEFTDVTNPTECTVKFKNALDDNHYKFFVCPVGKDDLESSVNKIIYNVNHIINGNAEAKRLGITYGNIRHYIGGQDGFEVAGSTKLDEFVSRKLNLGSLNPVNKQIVLDVLQILQMQREHPLPNVRKSVFEISIKGRYHPLVIIAHADGTYEYTANEGPNIYPSTVKLTKTDTTIGLLVLLAHDKNVING